jgi:hypothetical protein
MYLVHGFYRNESYSEMSRVAIEVDPDCTGADLVVIAKNIDWPDHLRPKLSSLFLETPERKQVLLERRLTDQGFRDGSEVRLRLGMR